jgi:arginine exporter protein ArgO
MKMNRSNIIIIAISVLVYSVILATVGVFGQTVQNGLFYFFKNILPIIGIVVGYGLTIFVPIRVFQAIERNKQIKADIENDKKLQDHALKSKELENNILNVLNKEDTLYD